MAIVAYWVTDGIDCCHVGFLLCHMVRHATCYDKALVQVTHVFSVDPCAATQWSAACLTRTKGVAWQPKLHGGASKIIEY
jgi:hypothetical protein